MHIVQWISTLLIIVYVCFGSGYAQINCESQPSFRCLNGDCIASELLCDGKADCGDSSDETEAECKKSEILCPSYAFRCSYGACINGDSACNGIQECVDNSDETQSYCGKNETSISRTETPNTCTVDQFKCDNGQCISNINVCDGTADCVDRSDETSKLCRTLPCAVTAFQCTYGACIDGDLQCNGQFDCADNSDEDPKICRIGWPVPLPPVTTKTTVPTVPTQSPPTPTPAQPSGANTCKAPPQPQNGRWQLHQSQCRGGRNCEVSEGTELGLGSHLVYSCNSGYKIRGSTDVSCSFEGRWLNIPVCTEIRCKPLHTVSVRAECLYDNEWISCKSPVLPRTTAKLECENSYRPETNFLTGRRRNVRCNANGQWEPEPMRCIPVCGILPSDVKPTVVGGVQPNITEFPWHASMYRDELDEPKKYFCGASIIQENLLITAAHCVYDEDTRQLVDASKIYILAGNIFRDYNFPFHNQNLVRNNQVKRIYIISNYIGYRGNYFWDIAILELVRPFELSAYLVPVCLDILSDRNILEPGSYGKVAGFGRTATGDSSAILQALSVPIISLSQCRSASQSVNTEQFITNDKFCAGYTNGSSVCDGDSGGGLVFQTSNLWYLRGIVSVSLGTIREGGTVHCDNFLYSLYTEISRHISWIQDVIIKVEQNETHILCSEFSQTRCS